MSAATLEMKHEPVLTRAMPGGRLFGAYFTEAKYETIRMLRTPAFAIPFLALPVALYLLFAVLLFGAALRADPKGAMFAFIGFDVFGVMGPGIFGFGMVVALEREQGLLALKRAMPMPPSAYLAAKLCMAMLFGLIVTVTMIIAALTLGHLPLNAGQCFTLVCRQCSGDASLLRDRTFHWHANLRQGRAGDWKHYLPGDDLPLEHYVSTSEIHASIGGDLAGIPSGSTGLPRFGRAQPGFRVGASRGIGRCGAGVNRALRPAPGSRRLKRRKLYNANTSVAGNWDQCGLRAGWRDYL